MNFLGLSKPVHIRVALGEEEEGGAGGAARFLEYKTDKGLKEKLPLYTTGDTIKGTVTIEPLTAKRVDHVGIRIQLLGQIEIRSLGAHPEHHMVFIRVVYAGGRVLQCRWTPPGPPPCRIHPRGGHGRHILHAVLRSPLHPGRGHPPEVWEPTQNTTWCSSV